MIMTMNPPTPLKLLLAFKAGCFKTNGRAFVGYQEKLLTAVASYNLPPNDVINDLTPLEYQMTRLILSNNKYLVFVLIIININRGWWVND